MCSDGRHNFLDTSGKIGLTLRVLLPIFDLLDELGQSQQISDSKGRPTSSQNHIRIRGSYAGPGRWKGPYMVRRLVKRDAVFPPIVPIVEDLKLLAIQGMERMGDRKNSFC